MAFVALAVCLVTAVLGALGVASPERFASVLRRLSTARGLYVGAAVRLVLGVALFSSAPESRAPDTMRVLGVIFGVGGLVMPLYGRQRYRRILEWFLALGPRFTRAWGAVALAFGLVVAYAVVP